MAVRIDRRVPRVQHIPEFTFRDPEERFDAAVRAPRLMLGSPRPEFARRTRSRYTHNPPPGGRAVVLCGSSVPVLLEPEVEMTIPHERPHKVTLNLTDEELRRWEHVRRSLSDGEAVPSHREALLMILELVEEASVGRLGRLTEHWRSREPEVVEE